MNNGRFTVVPSALPSYFGVGFNEPKEQFLIDYGQIEQEFDDEAQERMRLGRVLETPALDYFAERFNIIITDRNTKTLTFHDGKIRGKVDGMAIIDGINTVVECKISNAEGYKFTNNIGYHMQCQLYMYATGADQALLCGLYKGKPIFKFLKRDDDMIKDLLEMADFVVDCLMGIEDFDENFPTHLLEKYSKSKLLPALTDVNDTGKKVFKRLVEINEELSKLTKEKEAIQDDIKDTFDDSVYDDGDIKISIASKSRGFGLDEDALSMTFPDIDLEKYRKESSWREVRAIRRKKK